MPRVKDVNPWYGSYSCGLCPSDFQQLVPVVDEATGEQAVNEDGRALFTQDDEAVGAEMTEHVDDWHPETGETGDDGQPVRAHLGEAPPD